MLDLARAEGIITDGRTLLLAHEIRWIRNMVVHEKIPVFRVAGRAVPRDDGDEEPEGKSALRPDPAGEGGGGSPLGRCGGRRRGERESRVPAAERRGADRVLLREPHADDTATAFSTNTDTEAKKNDESGGSLLLWQES